MSDIDEFVISGPKKAYTVTFDSLGKYLFGCLKKRNSDQVFGVDVSLNQTVTCGSLLEKSVKLSIALKKMSLTKKDVVALICENTLNSFACLLALTYIGVPANLINFLYTFRELKHVFNISKPKCVICPQSNLANVLSLKKELKFIEYIILLDKPEECVKDVEDVESLCRTITINIEEFEPVDGTANDTILMCLSSGTTGLPKCVELTNDNFIAIIDFLLDNRCSNNAFDDVTVSVLPLFHIYGVLIYLTAAVSSMKLVTMKSFKPQIFLKSIEKYKATKLYTVPPLLQFLTINETIKDFDLSSVKEILVGGAPVGNALYKEASKKLKPTLIRELYGATELGGFCAMQYGFETVKNSGPLVNNMLLKVIDPQTNKSLPAYEIGELCLKGRSRMKGYFNNPTETNNSKDEKGFYRSGDLGYYDEVGNIYITGRFKELIKFKAFQVSPVEVENVILEHPAVKDCAVFGRSDNKTGELTTALIVIRDGFTATEEEMVTFVAERISPQKQLHGGVRFVNTIPINPTGKILRRELPHLYISANQ
ncbi:hypothetical protein RN001_000710 [Aquatica leii]|uniref:Luciferin 4-monooxygenase n=1 Tax=Aquatica leii TaxID=1421715 RepID=A0AAN7PFA0_9COLE|nr:hypothetical protein RN001_000710 [Aquatica leii]